MKLIFIAILIFAGLAACQKRNDNSKTGILSSSDVAASAGTASELSSMKESATNMIASTDVSSRHHWDSIYQQHESFLASP